MIRKAVGLNPASPTTARVAQEQSTGERRSAFAGGRVCESLPVRRRFGMERLYVVVRRDLAPGAQLAQSCHALSAFACAYPELHRQWHTGGQNLVVVSAENRAELEAVFEKAEDAGIEHALFHEPDFGGELTAVAFGGDVRPIVSSLPLALRAA